MPYADNTSCSAGCALTVALLAVAALLLAWAADEPDLRDASEQEVSQVAARCQVIVSGFGTIDRERFPSLPGVSTTIVVESHQEFDTKANCLNSGLKALGATSNIGDAEGRSLLN